MRSVGRWLLLSCLVPAAHAQDAGQNLDYSVFTGVTHSDNARRTNTDPQEDTTAVVGLLLGYQREQGRLHASVDANLRYSHYFEESFNDQLFGGLDALLTYWFVPERFSWVVQQNFGQTLIEPRAVETPDNRQNVSFFSTGPDAQLPLGERTSLTASGRWSSARYETTDANNQRIDGTLGLVRQLGTTSTVSLNAFAERVNFTDDFSDGRYDRQSAFLGYTNIGVRTSLDARAGYTVLHVYGERTGGPLFDITIRRELSPRSTLTFGAGTNLTDSAEAFRRDQDLLGVNPDTENVVSSSDPFQSDYASLVWEIVGARNSFSLTGSWRREDHENEVDLNRQSWGLSANYSRRLRPTLTAGLQAGYTKNEFETSDVEFDDLNAGASLDWQFAQHFSARLLYQYFSGSGDTISGSGIRDYTENRYSLFFTWAPRR